MIQQTVPGKHGVYTVEVTQLESRKSTTSNKVETERLWNGGFIGHPIYFNCC